MMASVFDARIEEYEQDEQQYRQQAQGVGRHEAAIGEEYSCGSVVPVVYLPESHSSQYEQDHPDGECHGQHVHKLHGARVAFFEIDTCNA